MMNVSETILFGGDAESAVVLGGLRIWGRPRGGRSVPVSCPLRGFLHRLSIPPVSFREEPNRLYFRRRVKRGVTIHLSVIGNRLRAALTRPFVTANST
jgi:hypothetical protein